VTPPTNLKVAIYARVSTKEKRKRKGKETEDAFTEQRKQQDNENQLAQLRVYATKQDWDIVEFVDRETGKHADRSGFQALFEAASRREIDVVLVWALDRFTREGISQTFAHIAKLYSYGVKFESLTEAHFRTTGPAGELMIAISAWIAKQERIRISDRTKAGLERARADGRPGGRPWKVFRRDLAQDMRADGLSWRVISQNLGIPQSTIRKALAERIESEKPAKQPCIKPL
jgi:DNA invertase Pin-like site-specific DNA recombinase